MKKFKILLSLTALIALMSLFSTICFANSHTWQQSNHLSIKLGVRDKYGDANTNYTANFVIYAPNNKNYYYSTKGYSDKFTSSTFPADYNELHPAVGDYSWQCYVDGEVVTSGTFRITTNASKSSIEVFY